jgi:hypothetical protein
MDLISEYLPSTIAISSLIFLATLYWDERTRRRAVEVRFSSVVDADSEAKKVLRRATDRARHIEEKASSSAIALEKSSREAAQACITEAEQKASLLQDKAASDQQKISKLQCDYAEKREVYDRLIKEVAIFDEKLAFAEMGVYDPHFDFTDSEEFKSAIEQIRNEQKSLVSAEAAVICATQWSVDGSKSKGKTMTARNVKLSLRAFNNECDAAIANARWNNVLAMEKRITRAKEQIDRLNASNSITITDKYFELKLRELRLAHEQREKLQQEREERSEAARLAREEQRLLKDMEQAQDDERHYEKLLEKAKAEAASVSGQKLEAFSQQIRLLERDLAEAKAKAARAQAMAERTSSGYVYVISNVGSFGADVVKIGLTRRLDPMDRVKELGDASVPFVFDTHAIIYSDNAPALERALHGEFESVRINTQNYRKEFFRVALENVEDAVKRLAPSAPFFRDVEAQEFRETVSKRNAALGMQEDRSRYDFPVSV